MISLRDDVGIVERKGTLELVMLETFLFEQVRRMSETDEKKELALIVCGKLEFLLFP